MPTPTAVIQFLQQQVPLQTQPVDSFGTKEIITVLASLAGSILLALVMRNWNGGDREGDRLWHKIDDIEKALLRIELDVVELQGYTEPIKEAIRVTIAGMVPRSNPLSDETNAAVMAWHEGAPLDSDLLKSASEELIREAGEDPKLTEAERMMFSVTAAAMNYEAVKLETNRIRIREGLI